MNIAIIGLGLLGGSFAYRLRELKTTTSIWGIDTNAAHTKKALYLNIIDRAITIQKLSKVDMIVLAVPVDSVCEMLPSLLSNIAPHQIVVDLSSSKFEIAKIIDKHPYRKNFISTHPMWGTEYSGPASAQKNAFQNKVCVICDKEKSDKTKLSFIEKIYKTWGMSLVYMNSKEHDIHTAYISHISHITSFALANTVLEKEKDKNKIFELAGSGFESTVRLAKSSASMWTPVFLQNKENVLDVLKEHIHQLKKFEKELKNNNKEGIKDFILSANKIKKIIK